MNKTQEKLLTDEEFETQKDDITAIVSAEMEKIEKEILLNALNLTHWNRTLAAKKLGMSFRSLRYRLKKFGLDTEEEE